MTLALAPGPAQLDRTPPHDTDAEQAILGACMVAARIPDEAADLTGEDFYRPAHEQVWDAITHIVSRGRRCDIHAVRALLTERGQLALVGGAPYLHTLMAACTVVAAAGEWVEIVADRSSRRREIDAAIRLLQRAYESSRTTEERLADADAELARIPRVRDGASSRSWDDIEPEVIDRIERGTQYGLSTPWADLDSRILGLLPGQMVVIAARPGEGKTLVGQALAVRMATFHARPVLYASLEMTEEELGMRILADASGVEFKALRRGDLTAEQWQRVAAGRRRRAQMPLHINDSGSQSMAQIRAEARRMHRKGGVGLVVVDHIGRVRPRDSRVDKRLQMNEISWGCKQLAKELGVPVVVLSQLNRESERRVGRQPILADLKETGNIEEDADVVVLMSLDRDTNDLGLFVAKNRNGECGHVALSLWGHLSRVVQPDQVAARMREDRA